MSVGSVGPTMAATTGTKPVVTHLTLRTLLDFSAFCHLINEFVFCFNNYYKNYRLFEVKRNFTVFRVENIITFIDI